MNLPDKLYRDLVSSSARHLGVALSPIELGELRAPAVCASRMEDAMIDGAQRYIETRRG